MRDEAEALYGQAFDRWLEPVLDDPPDGVRRALRRGTRRRSDEGAADRLRAAGWKREVLRCLRTTISDSCDRHGWLPSPLYRMGVSRA